MLAAAITCSVRWPCGRRGARTSSIERRPNGPDVQRLVVIGAGEAATQIVRSLLVTATSPYVPVALLDDDPAKRNLRISGVRVVGEIDQLCEVADRFHATAVLIAVPSADSSFIRRVDELAGDCELELFVLPPVEQPDRCGRAWPTSARCRTPTCSVATRPRSTRSRSPGTSRGRRVLVTGAGGSIGSELCRQIVRFEPAALLMLDRDENGLHSTQLSIEGRAMLDDPNLIVADIRDAARVDEIFSTRTGPRSCSTRRRSSTCRCSSRTRPRGGRPTCAARSTCSRRPSATMSSGSSTSAPTRPPTRRACSAGRSGSPSGSTADTARKTGINCVSVRFGNVLGSNGSVLKAFEAQSANGGPLTVTHPDITRYFMTIEEASRLIVHAGAIGEPGEVMILDMGEPVKILDVAQRIAAQHTPPLGIVFTGLRPQREDARGPDLGRRAGERKSHDLITHVDVPPLRADRRSMYGGVVSLIEEMQAIAETGSELALF